MMIINYILLFWTDIHIFSNKTQCGQKQTVIFPEGGGQPSDIGYLISLKEGGDEHRAKVLSAERRGLDAIHIVENAGHLTPGDSVCVVVDHETRWDHVSMLYFKTNKSYASSLLKLNYYQMTQHTGQHVCAKFLHVISTTMKGKT